MGQLDARPGPRVGPAGGERLHPELCVRTFPYLSRHDRAVGQRSAQEPPWCALLYRDDRNLDRRAAEVRPRPRASDPDHLAADVAGPVPQSPAADDCMRGRTVFTLRGRPAAAAAITLIGLAAA